MSDTWHDKCHVSSLYKEESESGENSLEEKTKKRKKEREKIIRERERKGERKRANNFFLRSATFRWSELVGPRVKVRLHDDGYV